MAWAFVDPAALGERPQRRTAQRRERVGRTIFFRIGEPLLAVAVHARMDSIRTSIIASVADVYVDDLADLTPEAICARAGIGREVFDGQFHDVSDVVQAWYPYVVSEVLRQAPGVADFDAMSLQDRLGTFCFMLLDLLESRLAFVQATFRQHASGFSSPFHYRLRRALQTILRSTDVPGVNLLIVDTGATRFVIAESIVQLIGTWLDDKSPERVRATALIDRTLALLSEIMTNRISEKSVELVRYAVEAGYLPLDRLPLIGDAFRRTGSER